MWQRIRRAVSSTLAVECIAAVEAAEACIHLKKIVHEMMYRGNTHTPPEHSSGGASVSSVNHNAWQTIKDRAKSA